MSHSTAEEFVHDNVTYVRITYEVIIEKLNQKKEFTDEEKRWCRPIAETLAMMDGNAFFGNDCGDGREWYEQYLPEAWTIFNENGGTTGWSTEASWMKDVFHHETPEVKEAYQQWRTLKALSKD